MLVYQANYYSRIAHILREKDNIACGTKHVQTYHVTNYETFRKNMIENR